MLKSNCSICLERINKNTLCKLPGCNHDFHFDCIGIWLKTQMFQLLEKELEEGFGLELEEEELEEDKIGGYCPCCRSPINFANFSYMLKLNWLEGVKRQGYDITHAKFVIDLGKYEIDTNWSQFIFNSTLSTFYRRKLTKSGAKPLSKCELKIGVKSTFYRRKLTKSGAKSTFKKSTFRKSGAKSH